GQDLYRPRKSGQPTERAKLGTTQPVRELGPGEIRSTRAASDEASSAEQRHGITGTVLVHEPSDVLGRMARMLPRDDAERSHLYVVALLHRARRTLVPTSRRNDNLGAGRSLDLQRT